MTIGIGMYVAACMENVKALTHRSDFEMQFLTLPLFPFVNINENERFILAKITGNLGTGTKNLFAKIKKEYCGMIYGDSKNSDSADKEKSAFRQLHRTLNKLEKMKLIRREKRGKNIMLNSTPLGILISGQGNREVITKI